MPDSFDEIREITRRRQDEIAKQKKASELLKQQVAATRSKFANEVSRLAPAINKILDEFGLACWGNSIHEVSGFFRLKQQAEKAYYIQPLETVGLTATATVIARHEASPKHGPYFIQLKGDNNGNLIGYSFGTYHVEYATSENGLDSTIYDTEIELPPNASQEAIKDALVKLFKARMK